MNNTIWQVTELSRSFSVVIAVVCGRFRSFSVIFGYFRLFSVIFGYLRSLFGYLRSLIRLFEVVTWS